VHDEHCGHDHHHHDHDHGHVHDEHCGHDHHHGHDHGHAKSDIHDDGVKGVSLTLDKPVDGQKITAWLNDLLARRGPDILRAKGIIDVKGENKRLVFQAVHMILEGDFQREWTDKDKRYSRMVFIGRDLDEAELRRASRRRRPNHRFPLPLRERVARDSGVG
jgi:G3E family GTPase